MRRTRPEMISTLLREYLRSQGLETPLNEYRLVAAWPEIVGEKVAQRTISVEVKNQTLFVRLSSPVMRTELLMQRKELIEKLNKAVNALVIYDLKII